MQDSDKTETIQVPGTIERGHGVASGQGDDKRYPGGTIDLQKPFFAERGLDLSPFYAATLNVSIAPLLFQLRIPKYTFRKVAWTTLHPPEDFSFSPCSIVYEGGRYPGWVYYPHPETKEAHFQNPSIVEVITSFVPNLRYGSKVELILRNAEVALRQV